MTIKAGPAALILGGILLAVGLFLGFSPVTAGGISCGSAFVSSGDAMVEDYSTALSGFGGGHASADCTDARSGRTTPAWAFLIAGGVLAVVGGVVTAEHTTAARAAERTRTD